MDKNKLDKLINDTDQNVQYIKEITDEVVKSYTEPLDNVMKSIYNEIVSIDEPATSTIEKYFVELTNTIYFINGRVEELSMYDGISKASMQEAYNNQYLEHQNSTIGTVGTKKPTVAESTAMAENAIVNETAINIMYNRAYRIVKAKIESAQTMVNTLSKLMSRRIQEMSLGSADKFINNGRKVLNEDYKGDTWENQL